MSKESYKNENDFLDSLLGGDKYGQFMLDDDADDKSKKKEKKKKLKKKLKKLGLDTSVLDEKKGIKKAKKMIEQAEKDGVKPKKDKDKKGKKDKKDHEKKETVIELDKSKYRVEDISGNDNVELQDLPPYYHDVDKDEFVIRSAVSCTDQEAVTAVKAFAKIRKLSDPQKGLFGVHSEKPKLPQPNKKEKHHNQDKANRIKEAIEVVDAAIADVESKD